MVPGASKKISTDTRLATAKTIMTVVLFYRMPASFAMSFFEAGNGDIGNACLVTTMTVIMMMVMMLVMLFTTCPLQRSDLLFLQGRKSSVSDSLLLDRQQQ